MGGTEHVPANMATKQGADILRVLRGLVVRHDDEQAADRDLLQRFVKQHDEEAFTTLVRRHGAMVMGVGLRLLRQHQDAEDVCQATFLLLAKKAAATAWRDSVAGWLYEVALHLALKAQRSARRRSAREGKALSRTTLDPLADINARDLERVLDEELNRLAEKYRTPLILCCLEGRTRDEAARFLGVPLSTVSSRLEAGRKTLRRRLVARGVPLALALASVTLTSSSARAAVSGTVARAMSQAALQAHAGAHLKQVVSESVASLVRGGMQAMFFRKLKLAAACGLLLAIAFVLAWTVLPSATAREMPKATAAPVAGGEKTVAAKKPQEVGARTLLLARQDGLVTLTPEGKEGAQLGALMGTHLNFDGCLSPDGSRVAYLVTTTTPPQINAPESWPFKVVIHKLGAAEPTVVLDVPAQRVSLSWAPGGKRLLVTKEVGARPDTSYESFLLDPDTGKTEPIDLPAGVRVLDWSRDGKTFLVLERQGKKYRLGLAAKGDKEMRELTQLKCRLGNCVGRLSPDGKKVLYTDADPADKDADKWGKSSKPYVLDVAAKKSEPLADFPLNAQALGVAWSPDGKQVAYTWMQLHADLLKKDSININEIGIVTEAFLVVADADGRNGRIVTSGKGENAINPIFGSIDWR